MNKKASIKDIQPQDNAVAEDPTPEKAKKKKPLINMERFGLDNEAQWLLIVPARFEDYKNFVNDKRDLYQGNPALLRGKIVEKTMYSEGRKETKKMTECSRISVVIENPKGQHITLSAFGRPGFEWARYGVGSPVVVRGTPKYNDWERDMEVSGVKIVKTEDLGRIHAVYPPVRGSKGAHFQKKVQLHQNLMESAAMILDMECGWSDPRLKDIITEATRFNSASELLHSLHWPQSVDDGERAQTAAKLLNSWTLVRKTNQRVSQIQVNPKSIIGVDFAVIDELKTRVPFPLTVDQHDCIEGIAKSLRSPLPMTGLLTGDVGTGKTLTFLLPMVAAFKAGKKAMLMTPNLLLIKQVEKDLKDLFPEVPVCSITGAGGAKGDPSKSIVIGTSALLGAYKKGKLGDKPDFLVIDEQHKFSVEQREALLDAHTNALEATATPIPRTAALATHGAKDLFMLRMVPVQKSINSRVMLRHNAKEARNEILDCIINRKQQAAVIYPLVESEDPENHLKSVKEAAASWNKFIPEEKIAVLHGKLKDAEKEAVLDAFRNGEKDLLLSSTVIEVGVTLPELKSMLVLGADRFGVVTLHQLRGRLARKGGHGEFMMFTDSQEEEAIERLDLLVSNQDGYELAEKDAEKRGYGDILGLESDQQSGNTRTIFMGSNVTPASISFATNIFEKLDRIKNASHATDVINSQAKKGEQLSIK